MVGKEPTEEKTEEAPASLRPGFEEERGKEEERIRKDTSTSMMIECHKTKNQSYHNGQLEERKIPSRANENSK